jgi:NADH-quinone oxidoreductase subunit E
LGVTTVRSPKRPERRDTHAELGATPGTSQRNHCQRAAIADDPITEQDLEQRMAFSLNADDTRKLDEILARYPNKMAACIPVLHLCQRANENWVSEAVIEFVAKTLDLSTAHVKGVVTFYTLFNQHKPGKHQVWVCRTLSCALRGSDRILEHCEKRLGCHAGATSKDGKVTLRTAECLASCGTAPMMQINDKYYENLSIEQVDKLIDELVRS